MSVRLRGRFWHYEFEYRGIRYRGSTGETSKTRAKEYEERQRRAVKLGRTTDIVTVRQAATDWWELHAKHLKSAPNINEGLRVIDRVMNLDVPITDLRTRDVAYAIARRREETTHYGKPPSNSTINREIVLNLRPILRHAEEKMDVDVPKIDWSSLTLAKPKPRPRELSADEASGIEDTLPDHYRDLFGFYRVYGVRWKEAFFPLANIHLDERRISLRERKGGSWHTIPIRAQDMPNISARVGRARAAGLDTIWFREDRHGQLVPLTPRGFQQAMLTAKKKLGIKDMRSVHDLRHDAAMKAMRRSNGNIRGVQALLGHENLNTTQIYAHAVEDDVRSVLGESPQNPDNLSGVSHKHQPKQKSIK